MNERMSWEENGNILKEAKKNETLAYVTRSDLKSSPYMILSCLFEYCHALIFLDKNKQTGTMGHLDVDTWPEHILSGWAGSYNEGHTVKKVQDIYEKPEDVKVMHIYHKNINLSPNKNQPYNWRYTKENIEEELAKRGFTEVEHLEIYPDGKHSICRDMVLDVKASKVLVFPDNEKVHLSIPFFEDQ
jgi:hypothetical protein